MPIKSNGIVNSYAKPASLVYLATWVFGYVLIMFRLGNESGDFWKHSKIFFTQVVPNTTFLTILHLLSVLLFLLFLLYRYFRSVYRKYGRAILQKRLGRYLILPIVLLYSSLKGLVFLNTQEDNDFKWNAGHMNQNDMVNDHFKKDSLHRGMSVFGWKKNNDLAIAQLVKANVEWVAVVPFLYQENETSKEISSKWEDGKFTRRDSVFIKTINDLRAKGLYVHLKPHLWLGEGWRSNLAHTSKESWDTWFLSYRSRMLHYAKMAQLTRSELFCVGTELRTSIKAQPEAWAQLIKEIREIYDGKLTYAANWYDEYEHIAFWKELDYIGIQAYFPLTKGKNPELEEIKKGWQPHLKTLANFSKTQNRPLLFTEVGYKSEASATIKPWEWGSAFEVLTRKKSNRTQQLAFEALFEELWHQDWFAGVYIWQWDTRSEEGNAPKDMDFSPRFKPAENIIAKWFGSPKAQSQENL